jgi:antitoxin (DNA-binding transcriptional repressor) of toxin-antitoxin stability system
MKVSAQYAIAHVSKLLAAAQDGEHVEIADPGNLTLELVIGPVFPTDND